MQENTNVIIYDGDCPLCTFQMKLLTWMDWLNITTLVPLSDPRVQSMAPQLKREELMAAIHCLDKNGRIHRGARCIRFVSLRMPLLLPLALFLWLPGVIWVAEKMYQWVSANRQFLSKLFGCGDACSILPQRQREQKDVFKENP
ncbi:MAG: DCC1-like thiol-disulfide oxidoreductase family protein [Verrucomicrobiota bacterium]|nr:DCC1-like thiol-disulfide oxidoreductase family protein [Verrucomicrobiota bacterium]